MIGLFIEEATPFLDEFFVNIYELNYPHNRIHLFLHTTIEYHDKQVNSFIDSYGAKYRSQQVVKSYGKEREEDGSKLTTEWQARSYGLERCLQLSCDYYLALDSVARLELPDTLRLLIEANRTIIAPLLSRPKKLWSNFWGSLTVDGYYARSHDYVELVKGDRVGIWNVPHIMNAYLIDGKFIRDNLNNNAGDRANSSTNRKLTYYDPSLPKLKPILTFSYHLRASGVFQFVINTHEFGHLVDPSSYNTSLTHPDFYQLADNMDDWERTYLHDNYSQIFEEQEQDNTLEQPCQDVFWFPLVNELFCKQIVEIMEAFGQWSGGTNDDPRIEGGYESVPTRDIHMKQVGLHELWLLFLREYVMPIQLKEYVGYEHDPPRAELAFVVRYHPAEQASLRAHHDSSTYTLNIALNSPGQDYEGGGCRFIRYNCSVVESRKGWALIHPGRLTHYHEGLPVTNGTRYIMVTFVDP